MSSPVLRNLIFFIPSYNTKIL